MEFQTRQSSTFIMNMLLIALALCMALFAFFNSNWSYGIFRYSYILWLLIAYFRIRAYGKYIYLIFYKKPALIVNEDYIYDLAKGMKYFWKDIDDFYDDNGYCMWN